VRSPQQNALLIILTHGWPGSIVEFMEVIGPLSDPAPYGERAEDAFHVVVPSLPGFAFSDKPVETGWDVNRIARAWATLMPRLGYGSSRVVRCRKYLTRTSAAGHAWARRQAKQDWTRSHRRSTSS
jgi:pimeloyl-ACP methyl ester carboxylesterase